MRYLGHNKENTSYMNVRIGICQWSIPSVEPEKQLAMAAGIGLKGVEPDLGSYEDGFPLSRPELQQAYREWREAYALTYPAIAVNTLCTYGMSDPAARDTAFKAIEAAAEAAVALSIPILQLPSFVKGDITTDEDLASTIVCLRHACDCVKGTGIIVGSENALPAELQMQMIEAVASEAFRIYFDTRNLFSMKGLDTVSILEQMMPYICEVHIKDGLGDGPSAPLGQGDSGFYRSMELLRRHNYQGWLLLENDYNQIAQTTGLDNAELLRQDMVTAAGCF